MKKGVSKMKKTTFFILAILILTVVLSGCSKIDTPSDSADGSTNTAADSGSVNASSPEDITGSMIAVEDLDEDVDYEQLDSDIGSIDLENW